MKTTDPHYDCILLDTPERIEKSRSWIKKLRARVINEVEIMNVVLNSLKRPSDRDETILTQEWPGVPSIPANMAERPVAIVGYHTTQIDNLADYPALIEQLKKQRLQMLLTIQKAEWRFDLIAEDAVKDRVVVFIWEAMWYVFGYEYLFDREEFLSDPFFKNMLYPFPIVNEIYFPTFPFIFL